MTQRQKVFGFKIPRWGEIWWCAPLFGATECNYAVIYNYRENTWYDTLLPNGGRSAAVTVQTFPYPIMASNNTINSFANPGTKVYPIWQHELGTDQIVGTGVTAINSYVTTPTMSLVGGGLVLGGVNIPSDSVWTQLVRFEPDFLMGPNININIFTREFPMDTDAVTSYSVTASSTDQFDTQQQARYIRYQLQSNTQGGYYVLGQSLIHYRPGDRTP